MKLLVGIKSLSVSFGRYVFVDRSFFKRNETETLSPSLSYCRSINLSSRTCIYSCTLIIDSIMERFVLVVFPRSEQTADTMNST
jgi:hypothetical protein